MGFDEQLTNLLNGLTLSPSGTMNLQPGTPATVEVLPSLEGVSLTDAVTTTVTMLGKLVRFSQPSLPADDPVGVNNDSVIGGQPMPTLAINLPGAPLPGALSGWSPNLTGGIPTTAVTGLSGTVTGIPAPAPQSAPDAGYQPAIHAPAPATADLLSGVPGLLGRLGGVPVGLLTAPVQVSVLWKVTQGDNPILQTDAGTTLSFLPPVAYSELSTSAPPTVTYQVTATVTLTVANAASQHRDLPALTLNVPAIPVPRLLAISTWVNYGLTPVWHTDSNDNALLVIVPNGSPLSQTSQTALDTLLRSTQSTLQALAGVALAPGVLVAGAGLAEASALASGLGLLIGALGYLPMPSGDYTPFKVVAADMTGKAVLGPDLYFDKEAIGTEHDHWYDMCESLIYLATPSDPTVSVTNSSMDINNNTMAITPGSGGYAGIPDLRNPGIIDQFHPHALPAGVTWTPASNGGKTSDHWWGDSDLTHFEQYKGIYTVTFQYRS